MRWFTDKAYEGDGEAWDRACRGYAARLAEIGPRLPADLAALATDPRLEMRTGQIHEVFVDHDTDKIVMTIDCGDLQVGYRRLVLSFDEAAVVPDDLSHLADAIGAYFRPNHWHRHRAVTEIHAQEVDIVSDGRFTLRLRLWPFYAFAIEFAHMSLTESPLDHRAPRRAGRFVRAPRR